MDDVNYVPPPNIASRKEAPIHRDHIYDAGEMPLPWHPFVARQFSHKEDSSNTSYLIALDKAWIKLIDRSVWGLKKVVFVNMMMYAVKV